MLRQTTSLYHKLLLATCCFVLLTVSACTVSDPASEEASVAVQSNDAPDASAVRTPEFVEVNALAPEQAAPPARMRLPEASLDQPVVPMGWKVAVVDGKRTTVWEVPLDEVGWHVNSAGAGSTGNTILSGRQSDGAAVFAPIALGAVEVGDRVYLTDEDGLTFVYEVSEISQPIPISAPSAEEQARLQGYMQQDEDARLTLITGWPDFTTTHRVFVIAQFIGIEQ